jgi:hypothetical protein
MLLSHKYKFIFIKTKKTAGTSIEIELSKIMSEMDIVTPIKPSHPDHEPRNYIYGNYKLFNHIMINDLKKIIPKDVYKTYFKFCVEREPVEKCLSDFFMYKNSDYHKKNINWEEYLNEGNFPIDTNKYTDQENNLCVDKILRYENLENEILEISKNLGFKFNGLNVRAKSGFREEMQVTNKEKKLIYDAFTNSNKHTGYYL